LGFAATVFFFGFAFGFAAAFFAVEGFLVLDCFPAVVAFFARRFGVASLLVAKDLRTECANRVSGLEYAAVASY
jgi:hypothetical protein